MAIIAFVGKAGSGKDAVAKIVQELYPEMNFQIKGFADKLRQVASLLTGIPAEEMKKQKVKEMMLGREWDFAIFDDKVISIKNAKIACEEDDIPWIEDKFHRKMTVRMFLQWLGTNAVRWNLHSESWVNALMVDYDVRCPIPHYCACSASFDYDDEVDESRVENYASESCKKKGYPNWLITDCRFPNELEAITSRGGICIRIVRPDNPYPKSNHESETALDGVELLTIINDGNIDQLRLRVKEVIEPIIKNLKNAQSH